MYVVSGFPLNYAGQVAGLRESLEVNTPQPVGLFELVKGLTGSSVELGDAPRREVKSAARVRECQTNNNARRIDAALVT